MDDRAASEIGKALSHPARIEYLRALLDKGEMSPSEFARDSDTPLGTAAYHARILFEAGVLELTDMVPRRGAIERRYSLSGTRGRSVVEVMALLGVKGGAADPADAAKETPRETQDERQRRLLDVIAADPGAPPARIAEAMEMRATQVSLLVAKARSEHLILRLGDGYELS